MLESLRTRLPQIDLKMGLNEVAAWASSALSRFGQAVKALGLTPLEHSPLEHSPLDQLVPLKSANSS